MPIANVRQITLFLALLLCSMIMAEARLGWRADAAGCRGIAAFAVLWPQDAAANPCAEFRMRKPILPNLRGAIGTAGFDASPHDGPVRRESARNVRHR
jgi:hypothetical protein